MHESNRSIHSMLTPAFPPNPHRLGSLDQSTAAASASTHTIMAPAPQLSYEVPADAMAAFQQRINEAQPGVEEKCVSRLLSSGHARDLKNNPQTIPV